MAKHELVLSKASQTVMDWTFYLKAPSLWYPSFAENMPLILRGKDVSMLPRFDKEPAICVAAGPSLWMNKHLELIAEKGWRHPILVCDRVLKDCLRRGIVPKIVATVDGDPSVVKFYNGKLVEQFKDKVKAVFSCLTVHPKVVEACPLEKYWFVPIVDDPLKSKGLTAAFHFMTKKTMLITGGHVGFAVWNLALYLGCDPVILVGYDLSYPGTDIKKSVYYEPILKIAKGNMEKAKLFFKTEKNVLGQNYVVDQVFSTYIEIFRFYLERAPQKTINCTEGGALYPEKVKINYASLKDVMEKFN